MHTTTSQQASLQNALLSVAIIRSGGALPDSPLSIIETLFEYECYQPILDILGRDDLLACLPPRDIPHLLGLFFHMITKEFQQHKIAPELLARWLRVCRLGFDDIKPLLLQEKDLALCANMMKSLWGHFEAKSDKVACLEALGLLQDKELYLAADARVTYELLLKLIPGHWQALGFLVSYLRDHELTEELVKLLEDALASFMLREETLTAKEQLHKDFVAAELAWIYLREHQETKAAMEVIHAHGLIPQGVQGIGAVKQESLMDMTQALYDCYLQDKNWEKLLELLLGDLAVHDGQPHEGAGDTQGDGGARDGARDTQGDRELRDGDTQGDGGSRDGAAQEERVRLSHVNFMVGHCSLELGDRDQAKRYFLRAYEVNPSYLPAIEQLVYLTSEDFQDGLRNPWLGVLDHFAIAP